MGNIPGAASATNVADTAVAASTGSACSPGNLNADINFVGNAFPAVQHLARIAASCSSSGTKVAFKLTSQARTETEQAFGSIGASPFDAAVVSMGVFSNLFSRRQLEPMTDLVNEFGARYKLEERMLVRVNGEVMAIAFMQNTQNLYVRQDLFSRNGLAIPASYAEMLRAAAVLKAREPQTPYPIAQGFGKGFDSATEFVNIFASLGGKFFEPGSAKPSFQGAIGVEAIDMMKSVMPYLTPNALASNSDDVMNQLQQGKSAMGVLWASRASRMDDPSASKVAGKMTFAAAPAARAGGPSAAHLWWDGFVMPRNAQGSARSGAGGPAAAAKRRKAVFEVVMTMLSEDAVRQGNDLAIWVRSNYQPGRFGTGVALARQAGAPIWPGEPFFSLAHSEIGKVLPDALKSEQSPQAALQRAAAAYARSAAEKGFLKASA